MAHFNRLVHGLCQRGVMKLQYKYLTAIFILSAILYTCLLCQTREITTPLANCTSSNHIPHIRLNANSAHPQSCHIYGTSKYEMRAKYIFNNTAG